MLFDLKVPVYDPISILKRLNARDHTTCSFEEITDLQNVSISHAKDVSEKTGRKLEIVDLRNYDVKDQLIKTFKIL